MELNRTASACYKLGVAYDNNGDLQEAIEAFRGAIELDGTQLDAHYKLAEVYSRMENFGEAIRCLTRASEVDDQNAESFFRLGSVHNARGSYDDAIKAFNHVIELDPDHSGIHQSLGLAYENKGEHNRAIEFFKKSSNVGSQPYIPSPRRTVRSATPVVQSSLRDAGSCGRNPEPLGRTFGAVQRRACRAC